jgi:hypothetical protein
MEYVVNLTGNYGMPHKMDTFNLHISIAKAPHHEAAYNRQSEYVELYLQASSGH